MSEVMGAPPETLAISHPEKVLFPDDGITKGDVAAYYDAVAPLMLPHLRGRPVTMERYPAGIGKKGFLQKDVVKGFPGWLERVEVGRREPRPDDASESVHYPLVGDARSLQWLANQNCVTPHVWVSRLPDLSRPDLCVFDLDPAAEDSPSVQRAALAVRAVLDQLALPSFVKTSGSKGFHIVVPLAADVEATDVWRFAHGVSAWLVKEHPDLLTNEFIKADRGGRIFVDTGRNAPGATFAAAYAVRARPTAPVSAPCAWGEIEDGTVAPRTFTLPAMSARLRERGDLWQGLEQARTSLRPALARLDETLTEQDWKEVFAASTRRPRSRRAGSAAPT
jgi:bifunctional non-homologous end joining protein LigD